MENAVLSGALVPRGIFGTKAQPRFRWDHWENRSGHVLAVLTYDAIGENYPDGKTRFELKVTGHIVFDDIDGTLLRTESTNTGPPGYPIGEVRLETDYADSARAVMTTVRGTRRYRNQIQFFGYRKYQADTTIRFGDEN